MAKISVRTVGIPTELRADSLSNATCLVLYNYKKYIYIRKKLNVNIWYSVSFQKLLSVCLCINNFVAGSLTTVGQHWNVITNGFRLLLPLADCLVEHTTYAISPKAVNILPLHIVVRSYINTNWFRAGDMPLLFILMSNWRVVVASRENPNPARYKIGGRRTNCRNFVLQPSSSIIWL